MGEAAAVAQSLPKVVGNEVKTAGHPTILHLVRISIEDRADITETTTAHREVQPRTWVETCRVNSVSILFYFYDREHFTESSRSQDILFVILLLVLRLMKKLTVDLQKKVVCKFYLADHSFDQSCAWNKPTHATIITYKLL